jgi:hypothetical protein
MNGNLMQQCNLQQNSTGHACNAFQHQAGIDWCRLPWLHTVTNWVKTCVKMLAAGTQQQVKHTNMQCPWHPPQYPP